MKFDEINPVLWTIGSLLSIILGSLIIQLTADLLVEAVKGFFNIPYDTNSNLDMFAISKINPILNIFSIYFSFFVSVAFFYFLLCWKDIKSSINKSKEIKEGFHFALLSSFGISSVFGGISAITRHLSLSPFWNDEGAFFISFLILFILFYTLEYSTKFALIITIIFSIIFIGGHFW